MELNPIAVKIATKIIKQFEGCSLRAYPDVASPLYEALANHAMVARYNSGKLAHKDLPENFRSLSGAPWSIAYGETQGVKRGDIWSQQQADAKLDERVRWFMTEAVKWTPELAKLNPEKIAAVTSFCYNVGMGDPARNIEGYKTSTLAKKIKAVDLRGAAEWFAPWNKAKGKIVQGLVNRRKIEADLFKSGVQHA